MQLPPSDSNEKLQEPARERRFIALDSQVLNDRLAIVGASINEFIESPLDSITLEQFLEWWFHLDRLRRVRDFNKTYVGFVIHIAVCHLVNKLPKRKQTALFNSEPVRHAGYELHYVPNKWFRATKLKPGNRKKSNRTLTWYDTWSYFRTDFLGALNSLFWDRKEVRWYLKLLKVPDDLEHWEQLCERVRYRAGLQAAMVHRMQHDLAGIGLHPTRWYGPSAMASQALERWGIRTQRIDYPYESTPIGLYQALHGSYYGARIEVLKLGSFGRTWDYDIRSAYPAAMLALPAITQKAQWYAVDEWSNHPFSIWYCRFRHPDDAHIGVFPWRSKLGTILFPRAGEGWYWYPEVAYYLERYPEHIEILEGWEVDGYPCTLGEHIRELYTLRRELRKLEHPMQHTVKELLQSIYGKFIQNVGRPRFRSIAWAGYITAWTRAQLLRACAGREDRVIAFNTDGILSTGPLRVDRGLDLGKWEVNRYAHSTVLMSGTYRLLGRDNEEVVATRGYAYGLDWNDVLEQLNETGTAAVEVPTYITHLLAAEGGAWPVVFDVDGRREVHEVSLEPYRNSVVVLVKRLDPSSLQKREYHLDEIRDWKRHHCGSDMPEIPDGEDLQSTLYVPDSGQYRQQAELIVSRYGDILPA